MALTLSAVDRQDTWEPHWLVELSTTATPKNFSDIDLDVSGTFYHGRITRDPVVERNFIDVFWGWTEQSEVTFRLTNLDGDLDAHYDEDPRATLLVVKRYDADSGTNITEFTGVISDIAMGDGWIDIKGVSPDLSFLRQRIPTTIVDTTLFGAYAVNLGVRVPLVFGTVDKAPLLYVNDNTVDNQYDYAVSAGTVTVTAVYRPLPTGLLEAVAASEYTVSTALYSGYTVIRFTNRQMDFSDNYLSMYADITGLPAHNPAEAVRMVLASTEYGMLSQTVDETTLVQAITDAEPLVCAGILQEPREAQDILRQLMMVRGMRLGWTSAGAITVTVDKEGTTARLVIRDGEGDGERNLLRITLPRKRRALHEATKDVVIRYKPDYFSREPRLEVRRTVRSGFGFDKEIDHDFIRDSETADRVVYYLAKREEFDEQVEVELTQEARQLGPGDLVSTDYAALGGTYYEALRVEKMTDRVKALLGPWSDEFYDYVAGTLPTDRSNQVLGNAVDTPAVPTGLTLATAVESEGADGLLTASVTATWTANTETDLQRYLLRLRTSGGSQYEPSEAPKGTEATTWKGLLTSTEYAVSVRSEDRFGNLSAWSSETTLASAKDVTAPEVPTNVTAAGAVEGSLIQWAQITASDFAAVEIYRSTTNDRSTATFIAEVKGISYFDSGLTAATSYYYWLRSVDRTGNESAYHVGDTSGLTVTTAGVIGYKTTPAIEVETSAALQDNSGPPRFVIVPDDSSAEVDYYWYADSPSIGTYWKEMSQFGKEVTAKTSKLTGYGAPGVAWDDTNDKAYLALADYFPAPSSRVRWAKFDKDGGIDVAEATIWTADDTNDRYYLAALDIVGSALYWALSHGIIDGGGAFVSETIRFARTATDGTVEVSPTDVLTVASRVTRLGVVTDSSLNSHIVYRDSGGTANTIQWVKVNSIGVVQSGPTDVFTIPHAAVNFGNVYPFNVMIDDDDVLHVIAMARLPGFGTGLYYGRMNTSGTVLVPMQLFHVIGSLLFENSGWACLQRGTNTIWVAYAVDANTLYQIRLEPIAVAGESLSQMLVKTGL